MLLAGGRFSRRKFSLGGISIGLGGVEKITLKLQPDELALVWSLAADQGGGAGDGDGGDAGGGVGGLFGGFGGGGGASGGSGDRSWKLAATVENIKAVEPKGAKALYLVSRSGETLIEVGAYPREETRVAYPQTGAPRTTTSHGSCVCVL
jgi:hypothetical protein